MWNYFNFDILSRKDLYNFIFSITERELNYCDEKDVSYKGNNKDVKTCPEINKPLNLTKRYIKSQSPKNYKHKISQNNQSKKLSREYIDSDKYFNSIKKPKR